MYLFMWHNFLHLIQSQLTSVRKKVLLNLLAFRESCKSGSSHSATICNFYVIGSWGLCMYYVEYLSKSGNSHWEYHASCGVTGLGMKLFWSRTSPVTTGTGIHLSKSRTSWHAAEFTKCSYGKNLKEKLSPSRCSWYYLVWWLSF